MASKVKWKESFQKARSLSQTSFESKPLEKKTSLLEEGSLSWSDDELDQYLGTLKKKSGMKRLWTGHTFGKVVDRTPDVSISSVSDGEGQFSGQDKSAVSDDDFHPKILVLSSSQATEEDKSEISEPSSIKPLQAVNMISDLELSEGPLELVKNVKLNISGTESQDLPVVKDVKSISNDLSKVDDEPQTLDEVTEEIEEDLHSRNSGSIVESVSLDLSDQDSNKKSPHQRHHSPNHSSQHTGSSRRSSRDSSHKHCSLSDSSKHSSHHRKHKSSSTHDSKHSTSSRRSSRKGRSLKKSDNSYTADFSHSTNENTLNSFQESSSYVTSTTSSSPRAKSLNKRSSKYRNNQSHHDVATQVNTEDLHGQRLGVGMATTGGQYGHSFGNQYPSPIAPHVVGANAVEALTTYNPAIVALTDMLKQQIRLVEQHVDNSRRMYESYTRNLNTSYKYTTLEDTMEYIDQNKVDHRKRSSRNNKSNEDS